jgi:hypothetical protein
MKKILWISAIGCFACCIGCNNKPDTGISAAAQKNLDAMHGVVKCFEDKDFSKLGDYIAADAVDHAGDAGDIKGIDSLKANYARWASGIDEKAETIKELADDEYAMQWEHYTGTYKADMMGHKAGEKFDMKAIEMAKFKDCKAIEHWVMMEPGDLMKMMGNMQMPSDSTKKKM